MLFWSPYFIFTTVKTKQSNLKVYNTHISAIAFWQLNAFPAEISFCFIYSALRLVALHVYGNTPKIFVLADEAGLLSLCVCVSACEQGRRISILVPTGGK